MNFYSKILLSNKKNRLHIFNIICIYYIKILLNKKSSFIRKWNSDVSTTFLWMGITNNKNVAHMLCFELKSEDTNFIYETRAVMWNYRKLLPLNQEFKFGFKLKWRQLPRAGVTACSIM